MNNWVEDAQQININEINFDDFVAKTSAVEDYMQNNKLILIAPKGYGKTLLLKLKYKMNRDENKDILFIPHDTPLDSFDLPLGIPYKNIDLLEDKNIWECLWEISIGTSIVLNYAFNDNDDSSLEDFQQEIDDIGLNLNEYRVHIEKIIKKISNNHGLSRFQKTLINPSFILRTLLFGDLQNNISSLEKLASEIYQYCLSIGRPTYVFIDRIDQAFERFPFSLWQKSQLGLIQAVFALTSSSRQIKIYTSIRKEALSNQRNVLNANFKSIISELKYSENELEHIFQRAIKYYEKISNSEPIKEFVNFDHIENTWSNDSSEELFKYIYRHTFQRPRDFIEIGKNIHLEIARNSFDRNQFIDIVNNTPAISIQEQYLDEIKKFTTSIENIIDDPWFFSSINSNVLTYDNLVGICERYNLSNNNIQKCSAANGGSCKTCEGANHIFCDFYKIGLLGIVLFDEKKGINIQHFELAGDVQSLHLPSSKYYLIHPAFDYYIKSLQGNTNFSPVKGVKIGYNCLWEDEFEIFIVLCQLRAIINEVKTPKIETYFKEFEKAVHEDNEIEIKENSARIKNILSSDGLTNGSQFITNILTSLDLITKHFV